MGGVIKNRHLYKAAESMLQQSGGGVAGAGAAARAGSSEIAQLQLQIAQLSKMIHVLWKEAENLEEYLQITPDGLHIKIGAAEMQVLRSGNITLEGRRVHLKTPGKDQLIS